MKHDAWGEAYRNGTVPPEMTTNQIYQRGFAVGVMSLRDVVERLGKQWKPLLRQQDERFPAVNLAAAVAETTWNECGFGPQYDPDPLYKLGFLAGVQAEFPHHNPRRHWWNTP
jgi:hypothetical protein